MSEPGPRLADRLEDGLFGAAVAGASLLGNRLAPKFGAGLVRLGYRPFRIRRDHVEANLRVAFPDRDRTWIRRTAAASYAHLGREAVRTMLAARNPDAFSESVIHEGLDLLRERMESGRGQIVLGGHLGNWELGVGSLALAGFPVFAVARRQRNPLFDRRIVAVRHNLGIRLIRRGDARKEVLHSLRQNRIVVFIADQDARQAGVFVPFFNRPASTARGPAVFALRSGAELAFMAPVREPDGRLRVRIEPLDVPEGGEDGFVDRMTQAYMATLEKAVREVPEQYLWHHRRWKTRAPEPALDPVQSARP